MEKVEWNSLATIEYLILPDTCIIIMKITSILEEIQTESI